MAAFKQFYRSHRDKLFGYLMRMTGDYFLAGDLMQETFTRYLESYGPKTENVALLYSIARNAFLDIARKQVRQRELDQEPVSRDCGQERCVMAKEEYTRTLAAIQKLDPDERDILALVVSREFTYRQIADIVKLSEANIKVKVHRARIKLKQLLRQGEPE